MKRFEADHSLYFRRGYKYVVTRQFHMRLNVVPYAPVDLPFIKLDMEGNLSVLRGYAWNGASGPTWDTLNSMRGSLGHDVLYQLIRLGLIDIKYKQYADQVLHDLCVEDGMYSFRADYWLWAVLNFGMHSCRPSSEPKEEVAP
ncbi:MAG: hypothetical protein JXL20_12395 [Deltaproteobacteria bacterium]|nr:hypothetical protein [Deltaproteobacteria bacterium]